MGNLDNNIVRIGLPVITSAVLAVLSLLVGLLVSSIHELSDKVDRTMIDSRGLSERVIDVERRVETLESAVMRHIELRGTSTNNNNAK